MSKLNKYYKLCNKLFGSVKKLPENQPIISELIDNEGNVINLSEVSHEQIISYSKLDLPLPFTLRFYLAENRLEKDARLWKKIEEFDGDLFWTDYATAWQLGGENGLFSEKFKNLIDSNRTQYDLYKWVEITVECYGEKRNYYFIHFINDEKVLKNTIDEERSKILERSDKHRNIIVARYKKEEISKYNIFPSIDNDSPQNGIKDYWRIRGSIVVSSKLKNICKKNSISGVFFKEVK